MAEKRTIDINIKNNADEATKDFKQFNDALDETAKSAKNVNSTFEEVYGDLQPLTTRLGEAEDRLYELAIAGDTTSKEYQELLTKVGEYRKVQIQTDLAVDGAAQTMTQKLGSALNGATSGFAATQGAMALFGSENEALEKSLLKVQSALAIQQGVKGLSDSYKELSIGTKLAGAAQAAFTFVTGGASTALKVFRAALVSTGIGLLVVGIGLLIANFEKLLGLFDPIIQGFKDFGDWIGLTSFEEDKLESQRKKNAEEQRKREKEAISAAVKYREELQETARLEQRYSNFRISQLETQKKLAGDNAKEIAEIDQKISEEKIAQLKKDRAAFIEDQKASLDISLKNMQSNAAAEKRIQAGISTAGKDFYKTKAKVEKEYYELKKQLETENFQDLVEIDQQIADIQADATLREKAELKKRQENYKNYLQNRLDAARKIEDLENSLLEDGIEKELEINRDRFRRLREDAEKNTNLTLKERRRLNDLYTEQELQSEQKIREKYEEIRRKEYETEKSEKLELLNFIDETNKARVEKEKAKNLAILDNAVETNKKIIESDKAVAQAKKDIQDAQIANVEAGIALFKDLAGENNKLQALAIAAENAVGIAKIIISTQAANAAAKLKYAAIPGGLALAAAEITANKISAGIGIAASIAAAAKGIASLKQSAPLDSGGDLGGGGAAGGGEVISPEFNVVGDAGINQLAQLQQQPTQAYVVSGEVTSAQALDRNRVTNATL